MSDRTPASSTASGARSQWASENRLKSTDVHTPRTQSQRDMDAPSNSDFSYQRAHTPKADTPGGIHSPRKSNSSLRRFFPSTPGNEKRHEDNLGMSYRHSEGNPNYALSTEEDRASHRDRFMSDAERTLARDPSQTRDSFRILDADQAEWHDQPADTILDLLSSDINYGLPSDEASKRLTENGPNSLEAEKKTPTSIIFLLQFTNLIIGLLLVAAVAAVALQEFVEGIAIIAVVLLNAVIATVQERNATNALEALQKMSSPQCTVLRDGRQQSIASEHLVTGDIVILTTGDIVPADIRLLASSDLKVNEMILTGESEDVMKKFDADMSHGSGEKLTASNMVFSSTSVATGNATGVVVETGMSTRVGSIAALLRGKSADGKKQNPIKRFFDRYQPKMTPLQHTLHKLGVFMGGVVIVVCIVVFVVGMVRDVPDPKHPDRPVWLKMIMVSVSLAVSAVPEGLPMVVTICLSTGTADMVKKNVLVRKIAAVESLGASSVICTDKTGTLTEGKMRAVKMWGDGVEYEITGRGFEPYGEILHDGVAQAKSNVQVRSTLLSSVLCTNTSVQQDKDESGEVTWVPMGNSSEAPLVVAAAKAGIWREEIMEAYPRTAEVPFSSSRKMMITVNELAKESFEQMPLPKDTKYVANVKGAPNYIIKNCTQYLQKDGTVSEMRQRDANHVLEAVDALSSQALRVLAVAMRPMPKLPYPEDEDDVEKKFEALSEPLIFLGLVASIDPPREGVRGAIQTAYDASIRTVMITGDYLKTAVAIGKDIGLLAMGSDEDSYAVDCTVLRPNGDYIEDSQLDEITSRCVVFARAKPEDKIEIVKSLQRQGMVAAMTGDGVNDAPALKESDIGVAMGLAGTAVAKGASDMLLTDDNFCSIVAAVEKGRETYENIQRFVCFLLSTNFGEITTIFVAMAIGMDLPLEPLQILILNIFADGMAAVALSLEKGDGTVMSEKPRPPQQQIIHGRLWVIVLVNGMLIAIGALTVFIVGIYWNFGVILQEDYLEGIDLNSDDNPYKHAVCQRWLGINTGWKDVSNCMAELPDGSFRYNETIRGESDFISEDFECHDGEYSCINEGVSRAQTMTFIYITMMEMFRAYTARSFTNSVFYRMFSNKWMQWAAVGSVTLTLCVTNIPVIMDDLFGFAYIEWFQWLFAIAFSVLMVIGGEIMKACYRTSDKKKFVKREQEQHYNDMMLEIRTLREQVQRVETRLQDDMTEIRRNHRRQHSNSTLSSSSSDAEHHRT